MKKIESRVLFLAISLMVLHLQAQNNWTWMNGSNTATNVIPAFGTVSVASSTNTPGSLYGQTTWTDANGNLWMFGGYSSSYGFMNDLWKYDVSTNLWTWMKGPGIASQFGLYGSQSVASSTNYPGGRYVANSWTDNSGNLWMFGGYGFTNNSYGYLNDLWKYNITSNQWTWMNGSTGPDSYGTYGTLTVGSSSNCPGARYCSGNFKDNSGNLWLSGGYGYSSTSLGDLDDLWKYDINTNTWIWMKGSSSQDQIGIYGTLSVASVSNVPGGRRCATSWTDNAGDFWVFGGYGYGNTNVIGTLNDLWKYSVSTGNWTWIGGSNTYGQFGWYGSQGVPASNNIPGSRYLASNGITDANGNLWLFGGYGYSSSSGAFLNDLWRYNISTNEWTWMKGSSSPNQSGTYGSATVVTTSNVIGARYLHGTWKDNSGWIWVYGGWGYNSTTSGELGDMWKFDLCNAPAQPTNITSTANLVKCSGGTTTLSASAGTNTIQWYSTPTGTSVVATGTSYVVSGLTAIGSTSILTYYAQALSCSASASRTAISITINPTPTLAVNSGTICTGGVFVMLPSGAATYSFSGGSQVVFPTVNSSYTVTGTSAFGCTANTSAIANVTVLAAPLITVNSGSICSGDSFVISPSGASTYTYSGGSATVSPVTTTFYIVSGTSSLGCVSLVPAVANLLVYASPIISVNSGAICSGETFTLNPSGAASYTYSSGSAFVSPLVSTSYTVSATNSQGCVSYAVSNVTVNSTPVITVSSGSVCMGSSFTLSPSGASSYTYSGGSAIVSPSVTTNYSVTGTSSAGCITSGSAVATVTVNTVPIISVNSGTICAGNTFSIIPTGASTYVYSGGTAIVSPTTSTNYTVTGLSAAGCTSSPQIATVAVTTTVTISVNSGTTCSGSPFTLVPSGASSYTFSGGSAVVSPTINSTYTVYGTNSSGCISAPAVSTISVVALPLVTVNSGTICSGNSFTLNPSGAVSYTYQGGTTIVNPTLTTTYSVVGSNSVACISVPVTATVEVNSLPVINLANGSICKGQTYTLNPSGAMTYSYSSVTNTVAPLVTTNYSVVGTGTNGCVSASSATMTLTVHNLPTVSVANGTICAGQSYTINPSGAVSYTFSGGLAVVSPTSSTSYTVSGTNSLGCISAPEFLNVSVLALPVITINNGTICSGNSFTLNPSGAVSYTIQGASAIVSPTLTSTYTLAGSNSVGCISTPVTATVTVNSLPVISLSNGSICIGQTYSFNPSGAASYTYSSLTNTVSPSVTTSYSVTGTSTGGCISTAATTMTLTVYTLPTVSVANGTLCAGQSYTINPTGANAYNFSGGSNVVAPLTNTFYTVSGTSTEGCVSASSATFSITVYALPAITVANGTICSGQNFTLSPGGAFSYTYSSGSNIVSPVTNTFYTVMGTSTAGCLSALSATSAITVNASPTVSLGSGSICAGQSFTIIAGGADSYSYSIGPVISPTITTSYSVTGSSSLGCSGVNIATGTLIVNPLPTLTAISASICAGASATLIVNGADTYTWSNSANSSSLVISPSTNITYTVNGTSAAGCSAGSAVTVSVTVGAAPAIVVNSSTICAGNSATLIANGVNTFTWSSGANTSSIIVSPTSNTVYTVSGNLNGCLITATSTGSVNVEALPIVLVNSGTICVGQIFIFNTSGASTYSFSGGSNTVSPVTTTNYSVTGTGTNGCVSNPAIAIATVVVNNLPILNASITKTLLCFGDSTTLNASGADTYTWTGAAVNGSTFIPTASGSYFVSGTNTLTACTNTNIVSVSLTVNPLPTVSIVSSTSVICSGETVSLTADGASTYTWSTGQTTQLIVLSPGATVDYTVMGMDANACAATAIITQSVSDCTGISSLLPNSAFNIYPNPTTSELTIETKESAFVTIINSIGQVVCNSSVTSGVNRINFDNNAKGIYFVYIKFPNETKSVKIIKQ